MRISALFLFVCVFTTFASKTLSQNARVNISQSDLSIGEFIDQIEKQTDYLFVYSKSEVNTNESLAVNSGNKSVAQYLSEAFADKDVNYSFENDYIVLTKNAVPAVAQQTKKITGVVIDNYGDPVIGANVIQKGTTNGTVTDFDGNYSLDIPQGSILQVSYIGYLPYEVTIGQQSVYNVELREDTQALDEVVVVGYGTMRKSDVTGSISVTDAKDILKQQSFSALDGLKGKAAGVNIYNNSGQPGGKNRVTIRGVGTINSSSDPLYVVDGVVMEDFKLLNPNDIERIEVLKDASSAAIYGARGANGVILVSTKRGKKGEGVSVSYDGSISVSHMARYMDTMNSEQWMQAFSQGITNWNNWFADPNNPDPAKVVPLRSTDLSTYLNDSRLFRSDGSPIYDTNWQKESTRTAVSHNHQINIQQGGKNSSVGAFLNFTDQQGIMLNTYLKRLNAKLTYDAQPTKYLSTAVNLLVNHTWGNVTEETGGHQMPRRTMLEMVPWLPVQLDGVYTSSEDGGQGLEGMANPVHMLKTQERMEYKTKIMGNAAFTFHLMPGLDLKTQIGIDANLNRNRYYSPTDLKNISFPDGEANFYNYDRLYWQEETYLTYVNTFGKHRINAMAGLSWQERVYRENRAQVKGFPDDFSGFDNMGAGTIRERSTSKYERWAMNSYFLRGSYTYDDKYSATVTARVDGSSKFGDNNKYAFFPSAGLAWNVSNEGFMEGLDVIDQFKLHTSYGITGNSEFDVYKSLANVKAETVLLDGQLVSGSYVERLPNPDLKWEKTGMWDIGFNLNLFRNRLNFDVSYYYKLTKDLLLDRPVPHSTGYKTVIDNIGEVRNTGIDFMVNTVNVDTKNFTWSSTLNFNYNKNRIMKLGDNDEDIFTGPWFISGNMNILRVGESIGAFWGYENLGVWTESEAAAAAAAGSRVGDYKISDEKTIIGKGMPDITGSFINTLAYKNFDFTLDLQFVLGVDIYQQFMHSLEDRYGKANGLTTILDGYSRTNPNSNIVAVRNDGYFGDKHWSDINSHWVANGSYLRANLIQLGYTFDQKVLDKLKLSGLRLNFSVSNAFLICSSDFQGYDPEATSNDDHTGQNIFFFQYPKPRTYTLGLNVTF